MHRVRLGKLKCYLNGSQQADTAQSLLRSTVSLLVAAGSGLVIIAAFPLPSSPSLSGGAEC